MCRASRDSEMGLTRGDPYLFLIQDEDHLDPPQQSSGHYDNHGDGKGGGGGG